MGRRKFRTKSKLLNWVLDWVDAILFAVVVVTLVNTFWFQAFKIPSPSMESSLYTGDHLFVSKLTYGARMPQTPLTIPFTHNVCRGKESYSTSVQWKYRRLPGFRKVRNGDIVVFGFPNGDTVLCADPVVDYHAELRRLEANGFGKDARKCLGPVIARPMDKKDHYVKRCVAIPGDTLEVKEGLVWINGQQQEVYPGIQLSYLVKTDGKSLSGKALKKIGVTQMSAFYPAYPGYEMLLTAEMLEAVKAMPAVVSVEPLLETENTQYWDIFPFTKESDWTRDFFGPLWIPGKGDTVELTQENLPLYERIIADYEHSSVEEALKAGSYTFKQNYYFMMGDNRHNSLDSRYWGFVPEDHVVGRPVVVWLSTDKGQRFPNNIRWRRFLKFV